jgi:hypothetical protein
MYMYESRHQMSGNNWVLAARWALCAEHRKGVRFPAGALDNVLSLQFNHKAQCLDLTLTCDLESCACLKANSYQKSCVEELGEPGL